MAQAYEKASVTDRERAHRALAYSLMSREEAASELIDLLDRVGRATRERGLADDKLDELLDE